MDKNTRQVLQKMADLQGKAEIEASVHDRERKIETDSNEGAAFEIADIAGENNDAILDLADYIAGLEDRVSKIEQQQNTLF